MWRCVEMCGYDARYAPLIHRTESREPPAPCEHQVNNVKCNAMTCAKPAVWVWEPSQASKSDASSVMCSSSSVLQENSNNDIGEGLPSQRVYAK